MTTWPDTFAALHRAHVGSVGAALADGVPVAVLAVVAFGDHLLPVIGPDWHALAVGLRATAPAIRGHHLHGVAFHGAGLIGDRSVAWTWGAPRCAPGAGRCAHLDTPLHPSEAGRVVDDIPTVARLTRGLWPVLIAGEQ